MAFTEFFITGGSAAADSNGGGPRLGANDGPVYTTATATVDAGTPTTITDNSGGAWAGVLADDWVAWNPSGSTYEYRRVVSNNGDGTITVHASCTAAAARPANVGGAWSTMATILPAVTTAFVNAAGHSPRVNLKSDTVHLAYGNVGGNNGSSTVPITVEGFDDAPGDGGEAEIDCDGGSQVNYSWNWYSYCHYRNLYIHLGSLATPAARTYRNVIYAYQRYGILAENVRFLGNCSSEGWGIILYTRNYGGHVFRNCQILKSTGPSAISFEFVVTMTFDGCVWNNCLVGSYCGSGASGIVYKNCVFNGGTSGISHTSAGGIVINCVFNGCTAYGVYLIGHAYSHVVNNLFVGCWTGLSHTANAQGCEDYNAFYNNTNDVVNFSRRGSNDVSLTGDPFVDAANGDFRLNATAGSGAACRTAGFPGVTAGGTGYLDIGALQHADPVGGGGGGACVIGSPIIRRVA